MAETVLSMAGSLVRGAVSLASSAAGLEMSRLIGVQNEIWFIKDELKTMQAFLRAAEVTKEKDELVKVWAEQVRDLAYDIQDCLEEFAVHVRSQSLLRQLKKLRHRHRIAVQIRSLKLRVEEVSNRNIRYNLIKSVPSSSMDDSVNNVEIVRYQAAHYIDEAGLVGFAGPKKEILEMISSSGDSHSAQVQVIWVVGAGGLGKTTLAKKVYESSDISAKFTSRAWITVSQSFSVKELLKEMIDQLLGSESMKHLLEQRKGLIINESHLADHLKKGIKERRYFLVLDDIWTTQAWDCIKPTFWGANENGSQVLVTTRNGNIVEGSSSSSLIYNLKTLEKEDATKLLLRKLCRSLDDRNKDQTAEVFDKILKKCGGLPLAIVTIGGLLATKDVKEWNDLYDQLPSELETNLSLEAMRKVVLMSYDHLPSHLKPCFLYLSIFPEDFEIRRRRLVDRWIAEGFVRAKAGMAINCVGETYVKELISRSMIQPSRVNIEGRVKSCRVHDIVRDIMVSISREENFVYSEQDNACGVVEENFRHIVCHGSNYQTVGMAWSHFRSLTFFREISKEPVPSFYSAQLRMLRVLDLENTCFIYTQKDINIIGLLHHSKYVNFGYGGTRSLRAYALPRSIGKSEGLQALYIGYINISALPVEISKLQSLRSLCCSKSYFKKQYSDLVPALLSMSISPGVSVPVGISKLKELQILEVVNIKRTNVKAIEELGELNQLHKLSVRTKGDTDRKWKTLCTAIQKLSFLRSLCVIDTKDMGGIGTLEWLGSAFSPPPLLRSLKLYGHIGEMPDWFSNLTQLVKIFLFGSKLDGKALEILGALPNLMLLFLCQEAYSAKELEFRGGAFPCLRELHMAYLGRLREVRFVEGASPQMESIEIRSCRLESGITGISYLPRLKQISLDYNAKVARLGMLQEEVNGHPAKPVLRLWSDRSDHDLGGVEGSESPMSSTASEPVELYREDGRCFCLS